MPLSESTALLRSPDQDDTESSARRTFWDIFKLFSGRAIPMALSFDIGFAVFASILIAANEHYSENDLAAATLISVFMNTTTILAASPLFALAIVASNWMGDLQAYKEQPAAVQDPAELARKRARIAALNRSGLIIASAVAVPGFLALFFSEEIARHVFRQNEAVAKIAQEYLRVYAFALPAHLARTSFEQMMFPLGKAKDMMFMVVPNFALGTGLAYLLNRGGAGIPALGFRGIALGYTINAWLTALMFGLYLRLQRDCREFRFFNLFPQDREAIKGVTSQVLKWSAPLCFAIASELLLTFLTGMFAGALGPKQEAAFSSLMQFVFLLLNFSIAFGNTAQQIVGTAVGAQRYAEARQLTRGGVGTALTWMVPVCILAAARPDLLRNMLGDHDKDINHISNILTPIVAVGVMFEVFRFNLLQQLRSLGDPWGSTFTSFFALELGLLISGLVGSLTELGVYGVGMGYTLALGMASAGLLPRWIKRTGLGYLETEVNERVKEPETFVGWVKASASSVFSFFCKPSTPAVLATTLNDAEQQAEYEKETRSTLWCF